MSSLLRLPIGLIGSARTLPPDMTDTLESERWIGLEEALEAQARCLGAPEGFHLELLKNLADLKPGMIWLSDQAITLHELPTGFAFDRAEFEAVLARIGRRTLER